MIEIYSMLFGGVVVFVAVCIFESARNDRIRNQNILIKTLYDLITEQQNYIDFLEKKQNKEKQNDKQK